MLIVPFLVEEELRSYFGREYEGEMGRRSGQGGIENSLMLCGSRVASYEDGASERALNAAEWSRGVKRKLDALSESHRRTLEYAFGPVDLSRVDEKRWEALQSYGQYPGVVLGCPEAYAEHGASLYSLEEWLVRRSETARGIGHGATGEVSEVDREEAESTVTRLRKAAEHRLKDALEEYGGGWSEVTPPNVVSQRQIAAVLGRHHRDVGTELLRRGVEWKVKSSAPNARRLIRLDSLWVRWPEAAAALGKLPEVGMKKAG